MLPDTKAVEKELNNLEAAITLLHRNYEIFFAGGSKTPPYDMQKKIEKTIRKLAGTQGLSYAMRFRYNTLVARYNTYLDLWNKQMKLKEEGKSISGATAVPKMKTGPVSKQPAQQASGMETIYKEYLRSRETTGEGTPSLRFESFKQQLERQKQTLIEKYRCKDVEFYVAVEQGKTKLKARPIK